MKHDRILHPNLHCSTSPKGCQALSENVSNLDAKPCVADLDAHRFCRGYTSPLVMMGVAPRRYLPGLGAMLVNEDYVFFVFLTTCVLAMESPKRLPLLTKTTMPSICTITYVTFRNIKLPKDAFSPVSEC